MQHVQDIKENMEGLLVARTIQNTNIQREDKEEENE